MKVQNRNSRLRHALRLTHLLQKERGASASYYAYSMTHSLENPALPPSPPISGIGASISLGAEYRMSPRRNASLESDDPNYREIFYKAVHRARQSTNVAFSLNDNVEVWEASLKRVREKIDVALENISKNNISKDVDTVISSHKVVVMYNILIASIINSLCIHLIKKELEMVQKNHNIMDNSAPKFGDRSRNQSLLTINVHDAENSPPRRASTDTMLYNTSKSLPNHYPDAGQVNAPKFSAMDTDLFTKLQHQSSDALNFLSSDQSYPKIRSDSAEFRSSNALHDGLLAPPNLISPPAAVLRSQSEYLVPAKTSSPKSYFKHISDDSPKSVSKAVEVAANEATTLLNLLLLFVKLKESTGLERAILCSLMALSNEEDLTIQGGQATQHDQSAAIESEKRIHLSTTKLFNDLVVEEANQRKIVRDLKSQCKNVDSSLMHMVEKFLSPGHQMRKVQRMIKDFNLEGLQRSTPLGKFWQIITLYIDQLHALELVIVEELGISISQLSSNVEDNGIAPSEEPIEPRMNPDEISDGDGENNVDWKSLTEQAALQELSKMSSNQLKLLFLRHVQGNSSTSSGSDVSKENASNSEYETVKGGIPNATLPVNDTEHSLKEWEIDLYEIEFRQRIGRGVGGTAYLAKWSGQEVAVKVSANTDLGLEGWYTEVHSLRRLHHPNVIRLLGSVYNPSPQTYGLVLEYCNAGDLSAALRRPTPPNFFWKIADDVANGMSYLHRKQILHRDIKPGNILLDGDVAGGNFTAKLTDFGVAIMHQGYAGEEHTAETGTYRWMSPEVIRHEIYSLMTDVYSYALVVWQLVTHEIPFQPMSQLEAAGKVAIENARPLLPHDTPELIVALIERCWSKNPDDRLPFAQITIELKEIHKALLEKDKDWLRHPFGHHVYNTNIEAPIDMGYSGYGGYRSRAGSEDSKDSRFSRGSSKYSAKDRSTKDRSTKEKPKEKSSRKRSGTPTKKASGGFFGLFQKKEGKNS